MRNPERRCFWKAEDTSFFPQPPCFPARKEFRGHRAECEVDLQLDDKLRVDNGRGQRILVREACRRLEDQMAFGACCSEGTHDCASSGGRAGWWHRTAEYLGVPLCGCKSLRPPLHRGWPHPFRHPVGALTRRAVEALAEEVEADVLAETSRREPLSAPVPEQGCSSIEPGRPLQR